MDPITISALISAAGAAVGGASSYFGGKQQEKANQPYADFQNRKNQLIDDLLSSLDGTGKYGHLFKQDQDSFQTSFVDPAKSMFRNQIVPQIQQGSIAGGMQRSSTLDDQLMRSGVDLDQILNQSYMQFANQGKDRATNIMGNIFGAQAPTPLQPTGGAWGAAGGAAQGFLESDAFSNYVASSAKKGSPIEPAESKRPGFAT